MNDKFNIVIRVDNKTTGVRVQKKAKEVEKNNLKDTLKLATKDILRKFEGE